MQLNLNLKPIGQLLQRQVGSQTPLLPSPTGFFDLPGLVNKQRRKGQFQYRFGRKVLPLDKFLVVAISASALLPAIAFESRTKPTSQIHKQTATTQKESAIDRIADAIFRSENSRTHPYGVMIPSKDPRAVCENTIRHAWVDFERQAFVADASKLGNKSMSDPLRSLPFISFLGRRYCPPSVDPVGFRNWTNNVYKILCTKISQ